MEEKCNECEYRMQCLFMVVNLCEQVLHWSDNHQTEDAYHEYENYN